MSDFLTNLAARAIGVAPLRPRLRMRFEPAVDDRPSAVAPHTSPSPVTTRDAERPHAIASNTATTGAEPDGAGPMALPRRSAVGPDPAARAAVGEDDTGLRTLSASVRTEDEQRAQPVLAEFNASEEEDAGAGNVGSYREAAAQPVVEPASRIGVEPVALTHPTVAARTSVGTTLKSESPHRYDEQSPRVMDGGEPAAPAEGAIVASELRARARVIGRRRQIEPASPAQPPVVHVSIGRVEVRAVTPTGAPRPVARRNSAMTIDDYVARRKGRR